MTGKRRLQFILVLACFIGIVYLLPSIGHALRVFEIRVLTFIKNVGLSQETGGLREAVENAKRELVLRDALISDIQKENKFLRERLEAGEKKQSEKLLLALVVGQGSGFGEETLVINKGSLDDITGGEPVVISPDILIGLVDELFRDRAVVRLVFDSKFTLKAKTLQGVKGVVKGKTGNTIIFDEVSQASELAKDDLVVTDNQDTRTPPNIPIGRIQTILSRPTDIFQRASVTSPVNSKDISRVFVILGR